MATWKADTFFRDPSFPFYIQRFGPREFTPHAHDFIQVVYAEHGRYSHTLSGTGAVMRPGDIIFVPPLMQHSITGNGDRSLIKISFAPSLIHPSFTAHRSFLNTAVPDAAYLLPLIDMMRKKRYRPVAAAAGYSAVQRLVADMIDRFTARKQFFEIVIKADLLKLLAMTAVSYQAPDAKRSRVQVKYSDVIDSAVRYIDAHYQEDISLSDAARTASLSPSFFSRSFKEVIGMPFVRYLAEVRVARAAAMLAHGERNITDICYDIGFNDLTHFCRTFKRCMGSTPSDYRRSHIPE